MPDSKFVVSKFSVVRLGRYLLLVSVGAGLILLAQQQGWLLVGGGHPVGENPAMAAAAEPEPLYWVAPMDANFRRDAPGLSPMGMELQPVYPQTSRADGQPEPAGTVVVSAAVENNLGVRTALAKRERLQPKLQTVGLVGHDENSRVQVTLRAEGWIEQLQIAEVGDHVGEGSKLFEFYSPTLVNAQEEYVSALASKDKRLISGALGRLQAFAVPESRIAMLNKNRRVPRTISYFAPAGGHVTLLNVREGSYTDPSQVVLELVSIDSIWVRAEIFERQSARVKLGQSASMTVDYLPGRVWRGQVDYVFPMLDLETRTQQVRLRFDNLDRQLKPNMFSRVNIETAAFTALTVPREALIRTGDQVRLVKALGQGRYRSAAVMVGREIGERVVILAGLEEGESVVISAQFLLDSESSISADLSRFDAPTGEVL